MKVIDLLDKIFFDGGAKDMLPILKKFAGNENAEIFGVYENYTDDTTRVMIASPVHPKATGTYHLYLGDNTGSCRQIEKYNYSKSSVSSVACFSKDEIYAIYGAIMGNPSVLKEVSNGNLEKATRFLTTYISHAKDQSKAMIEKGE